MTKEVFESKTSLSNHSTVKECFKKYGFALQINDLKQYNSLICKFTLSFKSSTLTKTSHYSGYQEKLYNEVRRKIAREKKRGNTFKLEKFKFKTFDLEGGDLLYNCRMWVDDISLSNYEMMVLESDNKFYIIGFQ